MRKMYLILAASAFFVLASGITASQAQQAPAQSGMQQDRSGMMESQSREKHEWRPARMGPGMLKMIMIMIDTDGDGTLSLQEVQAVHTRMFNYADTNRDGKLTLEELQHFFRGGDSDSDD